MAGRDALGPGPEGLSYEAFCGLSWNLARCQTALGGVQVARGLSAALGKPDDVFLDASISDESLVPMLRKLVEASSREAEADITSRFSSR
jgi:hypothetical protein